MKKLFCWRCQAEMPMLDEKEYKEIEVLYYQGMRATKQYRQKHNIPTRDCNLQELFGPLLQRYKEITGSEAPIPNEVRHHRISLYGPDCIHCNKPLRSPKARFCGACGERVGKSPS